MPNTQTVIHIVYKSKQASCSSDGSDPHRYTVQHHRQNGIRQLALGVRQHCDQASRREDAQKVHLLSRCGFVNKLTDLPRNVVSH